MPQTILTLMFLLCINAGMTVELLGHFKAIGLFSLFLFFLFSLLKFPFFTAYYCLLLRSSYIAYFFSNSLQVKMKELDSSTGCLVTLTAHSDLQLQRTDLTGFYFCTAISFSDTISFTRKPTCSRIVFIVYRKLMEFP